MNSSDNNSKGSSNQQNLKLYRQLRHQSTANHYPQFANHKPKCLVNLTPDLYLPRNRYVELQTRTLFGRTVPSNHTPRHGQPVHVKPSDRSIQQVWQPSNVVVVGGVRPPHLTNTGGMPVSQHSDKNNNRSFSDSLDYHRQTTSSSPSVYRPKSSEHKTETSVPVSVHNVELNLDPLVSSIVSDENTGADIVQHEYANGDFSQYLNENDDDSVFTNYPVIRPIGTGYYRHRHAKHAYKKSKLPDKLHKKSKNDINNYMGYGVKDIDFSNSKIGLGSRIPNRESAKRGYYTFGSSDADGFVNSQSSYEGYLNSRVVSRANIGHIRTDKSDEHGGYFSDVDINNVHKQRMFSYNSYMDEQADSLWKKLTLRFKHRKRDASVPSRGFYKQINI